MMTGENDMSKSFNFFDDIFSDAIIVVHESEGTNERKPEVLAVIPIQCELSSDSEDFEKALDSAVTGLKNAYTFYPDGYITVSVIRRHVYVNM
jgi:hypothetical protein